MSYVAVIDLNIDYGYIWEFRQFGDSNGSWVGSTESCRVEEYFNPNINVVIKCGMLLYY